MFGTMAGGENPRSGGQFKTWHRCIVEDLREFRITEGSPEHSPLVFGVETVLWPTAVKEAGKWYRGVLEAAERFMVKWHEDEAQLRRQRRAPAVGGSQGNEERGGTGAVKESPTNGAVKESPTNGRGAGGATGGGVEGKARWTKVGSRRQTE